MKKRIVTLFLAIIMLLTLAAPAFAESFSDVGSSMGTKYRDAINYMSDNGIMVGFEDGTFRPNTILNRGMAVTILFRMSNDTNNTYSHNFTDVPSGSPYNNAIGWAKAKGICYGTTDTTFEPYVNVTKQQFITFLYRFAGYCNCSQATGNVSLDGFSDSSLLVGYAVNAFKWAYNYDLFDGGDFSSSYLDPLATISRKNAALLCLNYRHNVEGIKFDRDAFRFVNTKNSFVSGTNSMYIMSASDWSLFETRFSQCFSGYGEEIVNNLLNQIKRTEWEGSCFGMAMATALDYSGKIDFNGNFCNNVGIMYDIPALTDVSNTCHKQTTAVQKGVALTVAESKINLLQDSQFLTPIFSWCSKIDPDEGLRELVSGQSNGGIGVFCFSYYDTDGELYGHAIVVYGKPEQINGKTRVSIYDVNALAPGYIEITRTLGVWSGKVVTSVEKSIEDCKYVNDLSTFSNYLDLDGADNTVTTLTATSTAILNNYTVLSVQAEGETTIRSSSGETITIGSSGIGGTMNTYKENLIVFGEGAPPLYLFAVPKSDSFTCVAETGELLSFHATDNTGTVGFSAEEQTDSKLTSVTVSNMTSCVVNGEAVK